MVDIAELRAEITAHLDQAQNGDRLAQSSAQGLRRLFNDVVPPDMRIETRAPASLAVHALSGPIDGRQMVALVDHFSRAVASIAQEVRGPAFERQMSATDYALARVYPTTPTPGSLVFTVDAGARVGDQDVPRTAERAMRRLAAMMPASSDDPKLAERLLSSRAPTARAMNEVAKAAKRVGGLEVALSGTSEDLRGVVEEEQAASILNLLADEQESVRPLSVSGVLDGMRVTRREFYLVGEHREFHGSVDEAVLEEMRALINEPVIARLEEVTRVSAGARRRPVYRLAGIARRGKQGELG